MKILLVNPWIYDFSAYDFGIKPVGLLRIAQYLRERGDEVHLIDCIDNCARSRKNYGLAKIRKEKIDKPDAIKQIKRPYFRYGIKVSEFKAKLAAIKDIDEIFVTSTMTYWYPGVQDTIKLLKEHFKGVPITLGGIYPTLCYEHAVSTSGADKVHKGDYLAKEYFFKKGFFPAYDLLVNKELLPIQLTKGCPFRCSYCASFLLSGEFCMKDPANLFDEVKYYYEKFNTRNFVFYDDALLYKSDEGIKKFLELVISSGLKLNFHTFNGLHARFITEELALLFKKANFVDVQLSLETTDIDMQKQTGAKVTNDEFVKAVENLKKAGFKKSEIGVYILTGVPWMSMEKTKKDIMFVNSLGVKATLASYSPIPGTKDYGNMQLDPLWHNKTIFTELLESGAIENTGELRRVVAEMNKS